VKLDKDRLYVSVFEEMKGECSFDQEAFDIWKQFVSEDHNFRKKKIILKIKGADLHLAQIHIDLRTAEERQAVFIA
jgi:alanyl-tRNA synthetase